MHIHDEITKKAERINMESDHLAIFISFVLFCVVHLVHGTDCIWFSVYLFVINCIKWKSFPIEMIQVWQSLNKSWVRGSRFLWKPISAILFWCIGTKYTKIYILIKWNWFFLPFQWVVRIMNSMLCPFHFICKFLSTWHNFETIISNLGTSIFGF